ncbi:MAG TPA: transglycosylase SLT domain-containing protein [Gemmatimonadota bacterium]
MTRSARSLLLVLLAPALVTPAPTTPGAGRDASLAELCQEVVGGHVPGAGGRATERFFPWHVVELPGFRSPFEPESAAAGSADVEDPVDRGRTLLLAGRGEEAWELLRGADVAVGSAGSFLRAWAAHASGAPEAAPLLEGFTGREQPLACRAPAARAAAQAFSAAGDSAGSRRLLDGLAADLPEVADYVSLWRLETLARSGDPAPVEDLYHELEALDPPEAVRREADLARARMYERLGDGARAGTLLEELLPRAPRRSRPALLLELGRAEAESGDLPAASRRLREIVLRHPSSAEAEDLLDAAARGEQPAIPLSPLERATILAAHGRTPEAVDALAGASDPELLTERAGIRLRGGDYAGAAADYGAAIAAGGDPDRLGREQAKALTRGGAPERARAIYRRLLESRPAGPEAADATYLIADTFQEQSADDPSLADSAAAWFRRLADDYPRSDLTPRGLMRLALLRFSRSDWGAAESLFRELLAKHPRSDDARAARYWEARSALAAGRADEARELFSALLTTGTADYYDLLARRRLGGSGDAAVAELFGLGSGSPFASPAVLAADTVVPADGPAARPLARARALLLVGETAAAQREIDEAVRLAGRRRADLERVARWALAWGYPESAFRVGAALFESSTDPDAGRLAYPAAFPEQVELESAETGLPAGLLWAIMRQESSFDPGARSPVGATGLLQLMPATARDEAGRLGLAGFAVADLERLEPNLHLGAAHLERLIESMDGERVAAIAAYNAGAALADRWRRFPEASDPEGYVERIPFRETRRYVKAVIANAARYEDLYAAR